MRITHPIWVVFAATAAFAAPRASLVPAAAAAAIRKLDAASKTKSYAALRALMEARVVDDAGADPIPADDLIREFKRDPSVLTQISKSIALGCEVLRDQPNAVMCPPTKSASADPESPTFLVVLRPSREGAWRIYQALFAE
jgi:hypothetical protein